MVSLEAQPTVESLMALSDAIRLVQDETGRGMVDAVGYAAVKVAESGRSFAKLGKKNRASIDNPAYRKLHRTMLWARKQMKQGKDVPAEARQTIESNIMPYLIVVRRQQSVDYWPSAEKKDPWREIKPVKEGGTRGLAKATWSVMAAKMAASKGQDKIAKTGPNFRVSKYTEKYGEGKGAFVARLVNKLSYLEDAYPGITQVAIEKGTKALVGMVERKMAAAARRANK